VELHASIIIYQAWLNQPWIRSVNYVTFGGGTGGGRAKDGTTTDSGRSNQFGGALLDVTLCCHEDLHVAGEGYISVKWLDLVHTILYLYVAQRTN
jgi:hypothetical protein